MTRLFYHEKSYNFQIISKMGNIYENYYNQNNISYEILLALDAYDARQPSRDHVEQGKYLY